MKRLRTWGLVIAGIVFPVALGLAAYFISTGVGASAGVAPGIPGVARDDASGGRGSDDKVHSGEGSPSGTVTATPTVDDHGGRCSDPEHSSDEACASSTPTSSNSGPGSSSSGKGSGGGDSHSPSDSSGKGSGDS